MSKALVIVESPAKIKTISKYLGSDYTVEASIGHIRDLPLGKTDIKVSRKDPYGPVKKLGIDPEKKWKPTYVVLDGKEDVVKKLKKLAKSADTIYLATDLDREGEAIAWHLQQVIGGDKSKYKRVVFNEITKDAIHKAFENPGEIDLNKVNAQQTRRFLDKIVGFLVSPVLWKKVAKNLSAGRVQSIAVELIVDKEREINSFEAQEFWNINADLKQHGKKDLINFELVKKNKLSISNADQANEIREKLEKSDFTVSSVKNSSYETRPQAPFITSSLQQAASTRLGFAVKHTMAVAQLLYEAGYITYMRTDATNLSQFALTAIREHIAHSFGDKYLPEKPRFYGSSNQTAQEAHEAIRPSNIELLPSQIKISRFLSDGQKLYALIRDRAIASQMTDLKGNTTTVICDAGEYQLKTSGSVVLFDGWTRVIPNSNRDPILPAISEGEKLELDSVKVKQKFTTPPARYSEASLVKELEKRGIGRPSTYAEIISKIVERGYVHLEQRKFYADKIGEVVVDRLKYSFEKLMEYNFTRDLENDLDKIATGSIDWVSKLDDFYGNLAKDIEEAKKPEGMPENKPVPLPDFRCPKCQRPMEVRISSSGLFLGCTGYGEKDKELACTKTLNLNAIEHKLLSKDSEEDEILTLVHRKRCPKCGKAMDEYLIDDKIKVYLCGDVPNCDGHIIERGEYDVTSAKMFICDKCGQPMIRKLGRFGPYAECINESCGEKRSILKSGMLAPQKEAPIDFPELMCEKSEGSHYVLRNSAKGIFFAAHDYPKHKEARAPKVRELAQFADRLPEKFRYLAAAPKTDPDGNDAVVRFSTRTRQQFIGSFVEGKATKWQLFYKDGAWQQAVSKK